MNKFSKQINFLLKRFLDLMLIILALPVMSIVIFLIAVLLKFESNGSVIFSQERVGQNGKIFRLYRFRTMYVDAEERLKVYLQKNDNAKNEWAQKWQLAADPRVTRIGKFLRITALEEIPQIFNILKGEMSFVGPRPALPYEVEHYTYWQRERLKCKPGLTGLAQINFPNIHDLDDMIKMDIEYCSTQSIWLDLKIVLRTISIVIRGKGGF